ncbi:NADPH:quinone reductase, partial [Tremellales sp. Uapishka_1]
MKAILIKEGKGPAENLYMGEEATPSPKPGEVLVKIKTFGLNRMDILQREGKYPLPPQASKTILGVEFAGTVSSLGEGVQKFKEGDEVFGLTYGGAYAEYIVCPELMLLPKPSQLSWEEAAGLPENWMTAFQALFLEGGMKEGQNVLIHAGASGVGVAAIQLALHVGGAGKVFATCGTDDKVKFLEKLGNDERLHVVNYRTQNFEEEIKKIDDGVDLIIEFIGQSYFAKNISLLRRDGTMVYLAFMSGPVLPEGSRIDQLLYKRLTLKGSTLRSRTVEYQGELLRRFKEEALDLIKDGKMKVMIHESFDWKDVQEAHKEMEGNKNSGKIVFEIKE